MAQSVTRRIERSLTASAGFRSRPTDKASICGSHQGQRSCEIAPKGRTYDCKRPVLLTKKNLASWGPSTHEAACGRLSHARNSPLPANHNGERVTCPVEDIPMALPAAGDR